MQQQQQPMAADLQHIERLLSGEQANPLSPLVLHEPDSPYAAWQTDVHPRHRNLPPLRGATEAPGEVRKARTISQWL